MNSKKKRAKKYEEKVVLKEGTTFEDVMKIAVNHSLKDRIAKGKKDAKKD